MDQGELVSRVFSAGVVGAGGAGFPTHVKLSSKGISFLVVNGAECEPLLNKDRHIMRNFSRVLVETVRVVVGSLGAKRAIFAVKGKHAEEVRALREAGGEVVGLRDYYPAGDEVILVREVLGLAVPEGSIPARVGVLVHNAETILNVGRALEGEPVLYKFVTVNGEVVEPGLWLVPIGVRAIDLVRACGGLRREDVVFVEGGPMTGSYRDSPDFSVSKTTAGLLVLPRDSLLAEMERRPLEWILKQARIACVQCYQCTLVCSRRLVGYDLEPHRIMRAMAYGPQVSYAVLRGALLCSECNICSSLHACPMGLSPRRVNQYLKRVLRERGVRFEGGGRDLALDPMRDCRLLPTGRLKARLGLDRYPEDVPFRGVFDDFDRLELSLRQGLGEPASPVVEVGQAVERGQVLASPPEGALGVPLHSPVSGVVEGVDGAKVVVRRA